MAYPIRYHCMISYLDEGVELSVGVNAENIAPGTDLTNSNEVEQMIKESALDLINSARWIRGLNPINLSDITVDSYLLISAN